ncbi:MAG TPA: hypothetical protein VGH28_09940 [Polyangiaceae bacterium]|jgi:hypothetical protein
MRPLALLFVTACSLNLGSTSIGFDIPYDIPQETAPGNAAANAAGVAIDVTLPAFPIDIDVAQQAKNDGVSGVISTVTLTSLSLSITGSGCFDFVDDLSISIASTKPGTTLPPAVIASGSNPGCVQTFKLTPTSVNLKPYLDEGAQATPSGKGVPPAADVTFDGHLVAHAGL